MPFPVAKVVSGGQTGVDQAALDAAIALGIPHGGWCPRGRRSENGRIPDIYQLLETDTGDYSVRTEKNICDSDATLILHSGRLTGGTRLTWKLVQRHDKPFLTVDLKDVVPLLAVSGVQDWLLKNQVQILNVAGPRESNMPGIQQRAENFLKMALCDSKSNEDVCD